MSPWEALRERFRGKWQMPLLVVSLLLLAGAIFRIRPTVDRMAPADVLSRLDALAAGGFTDEAVDLGFTLLQRPDLTDSDRAAVHLRLGRARFARAGPAGVRSSSVAEQILDHYQRAISQGSALTASDHEDVGRVLESLGKYGHALEQYESALALGPADGLALRQRIVSLRLDRVETAPEERLRLLSELLADAGDRRLDIGLSAIERMLWVLESADRLAEASTLLARNHERFQASDLRDRYAYLEGWLLYRQGHFDEAESFLRALRNRVSGEDETSAMTGWLLGRVAMADGGPQRPLEALSFFGDVMRLHPKSAYAAASRMGSAEALAMLERHDEAIEAYRLATEAMDELERPEDRYLVNRGVLRASLGLMADAQRRAGHFREAVAYAQLATAFLDPEDPEQATAVLQGLGEMQVLYGEALEGDSPVDEASLSRMDEVSSPAAREVFAGAASTYLQIAQLNAMNEPLAADAMWRAAELSAQAGERDRAGKLYETFVAERPLHAMVPGAMLRIGQLRQASGDLLGAIEAYQACYQRFPRTLAGARALVPLVRCYLAMGPANEDLAEKTLRIVLEDSEVFTPEAPEFADALFLYGDALNRRGDYPRAIAVLEEVIERYRDDARAVRAMYLLADSHRKSGLALKAETANATSAGEVDQMRSEYTARFQAAERLYRQLITDYEARDPAALDRLERMYLRHGYLYEADCYFEIQDYRRALKLYEETSGLYKDTPSALAAYVQIINSYVFLGEPAGAQAALARALVLVDAMPEEAFANAVSPETRADWKRYFGWLRESELF